MGFRWIGYLHLSLSQRRVLDRWFLTKHSRCFDTDTKGADGAADLLEALSHSTQLEHLDLLDCNQIPDRAWEQIPDGTWPKLKRAYGIPEEELQRLQLGAEGATRRTPSTSTLEIAAGDSVALAGPRRLKIAVARELDSDAMEVMSCLSSSPIEVLDLRNCPRIPAAAWQKVRSAKWLNLKKADFTQCLAERNGWRMLKVFLISSGWEVALWVQVDLYGFQMDWVLHLSLSQGVFDRLFLTFSDKTLQVLRHWHPRSRWWWRRRFASRVEPVDPAGRVGFHVLFGDSSSSVAKSS